MRILYVTTVGITMGFFENEFKHLLAQGHTVELACSSSWDYKENIASLGLTRYDLPFSRSPFSGGNRKALKELKKLVEEKKYDIVHCHTPNAAAVTRMACKKVRKMGTKVIYTAHGFHFYKGAPGKNWMIFYPVEKICAPKTDVLITMNREDFSLAQKKMKAGRVEYIPGVGIDVSRFKNAGESRKAKREELGIPQDAKVLLSVGELNDNKNHSTVIRAIQGMDVYYLIAGKGEKEETLQNLAAECEMQERVKLLGFRTDIPELLQAADVFAFPSFREGLSVSLMETMASGKPAVVSRIRGNVDLIDENGGTLFDPHKVEECREAIRNILHEDLEKLGTYNKEKVKGFSTEIVLQKIDEIYTSVTGGQTS